MRSGTGLTAKVELEVMVSQDAAPALLAELRQIGCHTIYITRTLGIWSTTFHIGSWDCADLFMVGAHLLRQISDCAQESKIGTVCFSGCD